MATVVITGANRGIGLEFCKQYQSVGFDVVAVCRVPSDDLTALAVKVVSGIDVTKEADLEKLKAELSGVKIDLLINNAGQLITDRIGELTSTDIVQQFQINAVAPMLLTEALLPSLADGAKVAMITSRMGSISDNSSGGYYGYRMSKAALNSGAVSLALDLSPRNISVGIYHPGYVRTDMTSHQGTIDPIQSVTGIRKRISDLTVKTSGQFFHTNGELLPW